MVMGSLTGPFLVFRVMRSSLGHESGGMGGRAMAFEDLRSRKSVLWASVAFVLFLAAAVAVSCSQGGGRLSAGLALPSAGRPGVVPPMSEVPPMGEVVVSRIPEAAVKPAWESSFSDAVLASTAASGDYVVANVTYKEGRRSVPGFQVLGRNGKVLWERRFSDNRYRYSRADSLAGGQFIGAVVLDYYDKGLFYLFDKDGRLLWTPRNVTGSITSLMSADGSRLALLDDSNHRLYVLTGAGEELASFSVSARVTLRFTDGGDDLFVLDGDKIHVVDRKGGSTQFQGSVAAPSDLQVSPDGRYVAVTTTDGVDYLNLFRGDGELGWKYPVDPGGTDKLVFSSDGRYLVLYDFGTRGGIAVFRVEDGAILWRSYFTPSEGRRGSVRSASIRPDTLEVEANYVESYRLGKQTVEENYLVVFTRQGQAQWRVTLEANVDLDASSDGSVVAVTTNNSIQVDGSVTNRLFWYDLLALFNLKGGK